MGRGGRDIVLASGATHSSFIKLELRSYLCLRTCRGLGWISQRCDLWTSRRSRAANETDMASWSRSVSRQRDETIITYITILIRRRVSQSLNCRSGHGDSKWGAQTDIVVVIRRGSFICSGCSQRDHHAALIKWCDQCRINNDATDGRGEHANCLFNWQKKPSVI